MYKALKLKIELKSPLIIAHQSGDSTLTKTLSYIPGTSILGVLASNYLKNNGDMPEFYRLFIRGGLCFHNLYPEYQSHIYLPCPHNIWQNKNNNKKVLNIFNNEAMDLDYRPIESFAYVNDDDDIMLYQPHKEIFFHHERDYATGIPKQSIVFCYEALSPEQVFVGTIYGDEIDLQLIKGLLENNLSFRLGKSKTAQYGNCLLKECEIQEHNIQNFASSDNPLLVLISDTIIKNDYGCSTIETNQLEKILGVKILHSSIISGRIETVVNAYKAKKSSELVYKAGSCFLLEKMPENFSNLLLYGLGERCNEGFGQIKFMKNPTNRLKIISTTMNSVQKPATNPPDIIKGILSKSIEQIITAYLTQVANDKAGTIKHYKINNSLLGRLESFAEHGNFNESIIQLKKLAQDKLKQVYLTEDKKNFYDYLMSIDTIVSTFLENTKQLYVSDKKIINDVYAEIELDKFSLDKAKKIFLKALFLCLRRENQRSRRTNENR